MVCVRSKLKHYAVMMKSPLSGKTEIRSEKTQLHAQNNHHFHVLLVVATKWKIICINEIEVVKIRM
jgi:hypothetical protein